MDVQSQTQMPVTVAPLPRRINHVLHFWITVVTLGLWGLAWTYFAISAHQAHQRAQILLLQQIASVQGGVPQATVDYKL